MIFRKKYRIAHAVLFLLAIFALSLILSRNAEHTVAPTPSSFVQTQESAPNSHPPRDEMIPRAALADSGVADDAAVAAMPAALAKTTLDTVAVLALPQTPLLDDSLHRYGARATNMQMLVELLEEKQLLMEEKVELSRRLEIVEILDSVALGSSSSDTPTAEQPASDSLRSLDSRFFNAPVFVDSLKSAATIPPRN